MTSEHVIVNRENWDKDAPNWVERGRRSWAGEPTWGIWWVPEATLGALASALDHTTRLITGGEGRSIGQSRTGSAILARRFA